MFGLFRTNTGPKIIDKIWLSKQAKYKACAAMVSVNPNCVFVCWFEETRNELMRALGVAEPRRNTRLASSVQGEDVSNKVVAFAEHYPLHPIEQDLFISLGLSEVPVLCALDEPLFKMFAGENLINILKKLGTGDDEVIAHSMVTKSIRRAQEKIGQIAVSETKASSQEQWFMLNVPTK